MHLKYSSYLFSLALISLGLGLSLYVFQRPSWANMMVSEQLNLYGHIPVFNASYSLSSFFHAFGFALLSAMLLNKQRYIALSCGFWLLLEWAFELGQHVNLQNQLQPLLLPDLEGKPSILARYFLAGTFDVHDLLAALIGVVAAYGLSSFLLRHLER